MLKRFAICTQKYCLHFSLSGIFVHAVGLIAARPWLCFTTRLLLQLVIVSDGALHFKNAVHLKRNLKQSRRCIMTFTFTFSRRFYPKRLTLHSSYSFYILSALAFPGNRTHDLGVASAMLYHLSYRKAV